jgi:hypothetical protein
MHIHMHIHKLTSTSACTNAHTQTHTHKRTHIHHMHKQGTRQLANVLKRQPDIEELGRALKADPM